MKRIITALHKVKQNNEYASPSEYYHVLVKRYVELGMYEIDRNLMLGYRNKNTWEEVVIQLETKLKNKKNESTIK